MPGKSLCTIYQEKCQLWKMSLLLSSPKPERLSKRTLDSWQGLGAFSARWAVLLHFFTFLLNKRGDQGKENSVLKIVSTKENIRHWNYRYVIYEEAGNSNSVRGVSLRTPHPEDLKRTSAHHLHGDETLCGKEVSHSGTWADFLSWLSLDARVTDSQVWGVDIIRSINLVENKKGLARW